MTNQIDKESIFCYLDSDDPDRFEFINDGLELCQIVLSHLARERKSVGVGGNCVVKLCRGLTASISGPPSRSTLWLSGERGQSCP